MRRDRIAQAFAGRHVDRAAHVDDRCAVDLCDFGRQPLIDGRDPTDPERRPNPCLSARSASARPQAAADDPNVTRREERSETEPLQPLASIDHSERNGSWGSSSSSASSKYVPNSSRSQAIMDVPFPSHHYAEAQLIRT